MSGGNVTAYRLHKDCNPLYGLMVTQRWLHRWLITPPYQFVGANPTQRSLYQLINIIVVKRTTAKKPVNIKPSSFLKLPDAIIERKDLDYRDKAVLGEVLATCSSKGFSTAPSMYFEFSTGLGRLSMRRAFKRLTQKGLIHFRSEGGGSGTKINKIYPLLGLDTKTVFNLYHTPPVTALLPPVEDISNPHQLPYSYGKKPVFRLLKVYVYCWKLDYQNNMPADAQKKVYGYINQLLGKYTEWEIALMVLLHWQRYAMEGVEMQKTPTSSLITWINKDEVEFERFCMDTLHIVKDQDEDAHLVERVKESLYRIEAGLDFQEVFMNND